MAVWHSWTLDDWNSALVEAVFFDRARLNIPVTRIQASDRFLATCTGDPACTHSSAQRGFIAAFGSNAQIIRARYAKCQARRSETSSGYPTAFAELYLTLLAASADETTHDEGNFRNRFVDLFYPLQFTAPDFSHLPKLWMQVAAWSKQRASRSADCRVLVLPSPSRGEKLIGYSKRLAFPAYADEMRLQRRLRVTATDARSSFAGVARTIAQELNSFSAAFQEEYALFVALVVSGKSQEAFESPLWGAVLAITWEQDRAESVQNGVFRLGIDAGDPGCAEFYLLADDTGRDRLRAYASRPVATGCGLPHAMLAPSQGFWTPELLSAAGQGRLANMRIWRLLKLGCLALFPDTQGNLTADGEHYDGAPACLVSREEAGKLLLSRAASLQLKCIDAQLGGAFGAWKVLLFGSLGSVALARLADCLPPEMRGAFPSEWSPSRAILAGAAWYGQSLLLNPASIPWVRWPGAQTGHFEITSESGVAVCSGELEELDEGFRIPPLALANFIDGRRVQFSLSGPSGSVQAGVPIADHFPLELPVVPPSPGLWLADGRSGLLVPADGLYAHQLACGGTSFVLPIFSRDCAGTGGGLNCEASMGSLLSWIGEALSLRYQTRASLPFEELMVHVSSACAAASLQAWRVKRLLFAAGWLIRVQRHSSPYTLAMMARRTVSISEEDPQGWSTIRLSGMFCRSELATIEAKLGAGCNLRRIELSDHGIGLGAFEARTADLDLVNDLATGFGLELLEMQAFGAPLLLSGEAEGPWAASSVPPLAVGLEEWSVQGKKWGNLSAAPHGRDAGALFRMRGTQRTSFWVTSKQGYWKTDSAAWAHILRLAAVGQPTGWVAEDGTCRFSPEAAYLPAALSKWWLHFGGGFIGILPTGSIFFGGHAPATIWLPLKGLFANLPQQQATTGIAENRRRLALRLRHSRFQGANFEE